MSNEELAEALARIIRDNPKDGMTVLMLSAMGVLGESNAGQMSMKSDGDDPVFIFATNEKELIPMLETIIHGFNTMEDSK